MMIFDIQLADELSAIAHLPVQEISDMLEIPPDRQLGDRAFPCFKLAKTMRKNPQLIAQEIADHIKKPNFIERIETKGAYVNFFFNRAVFAQTVLEDILNKGERYGSSDKGNGSVICIDFSAPNIAKPFHIGHLRSTVIGNSLYKIYEFLGYKCIGINHLGDWGTQFGKLITAYKHWGIKDDLEKEPIRALLDIYVKFHDEAEKDPSLEDEARMWFKRMEDGDEEALSLWRWFKDLSLREFNKIYDMLGVKFDYYTGESFYNDKMDRVVELLQEKGLLTESQGALVVDLSQYDMPPCMIKKTDGTTLYATRDITAAIYRKETFDFDKCLYVVAYQQDLHFRQLFKVIELMGFDWYDKLFHVPFGMVSMEEGTLSTRKGRVVFLEDVLQKAVDRTLDIIKEKNPGLENKEDVAKQVGIGAVVFHDLINNRIKDIVFSWDQVLNFDGETGPYVQYAHARAMSILAKATQTITGEMGGDLLTEDETLELIDLLARFPEAIEAACQANEPSIVARHTIDIAQAFNKFYKNHMVIVEDDELQRARLTLVYATAQVIRIGLGLLGIQAPAKM
ncbi:arginine--tRNA ligase [Mahella australiensis]|uniref:Arginine--tRNA ligase n=1 Tax=Mahella australiensis (strain DSM 15567 / CIP 107919 / 50-1 BON) TaxID=697281 RepID=F3ZZZ2_MAHA5|nr:arginine--tRNA ligase [Mahella australiensis]AEE95810.1 arginyl-tRNA synthetase [Mahella australiensis 50-1 BON]